MVLLSEYKALFVELEYCDAHKDYLLIYIDYEKTANQVLHSAFIFSNLPEGSHLGTRYCDKQE